MNVIIVSPAFDADWPLAAERLRVLWSQRGQPFEFIRIKGDDSRSAASIATSPASVRRLACLGVPFTASCLGEFSSLRELTINGSPDPQIAPALESRGVLLRFHQSQGFWGQSVAECALGLTLASLRRLAHTHQRIQSSHAEWDYSPPGGVGTPGARGAQFCDDPRFAHGTLHGKRVRIVGAGNIGARYAAFASFIGAEVAMWDPVAPEPCFHRSGARRELRLERLVADAQIFAPMLPLLPATRGLVRAELIDALPRGCLVVLTTRAAICDMAALRRRVLADELSLAADVFDAEPLPLDDPLLGRDNVVHVPHLAGRTEHANHAWAEMLNDQFDFDQDP